MSYDWTPERYRTRQPTCWDPPWTRRRQPTCWDPPWTRRTTAYQHSSSYDLDMYSPSPPRRRPTCWDPPVYRETPRQLPFNEVSVYDQPLAPDPNSRWNQPYTARDTAALLHTFPRRYSVRGPASQQPRSAILAEDPINAKLDHLLEVWDRKETLVDATDHRVSKFRSVSKPDQPDVSSSRRTLEYPPSRNSMASRGQSGLYPNVSSAPPRHSTTESTNRRPDFRPPQGNPSIQRRPLVFQQSDQPATRQPSCWESPLTVTIAAQQPHQNDQPPPPPLPQSDRQPQQPSPSPPLELLTHAAPRPFQPLRPLSVTVPLLASNGHSQAVPSSRKKEWQTNLHNADEYGLSKVVPCLLDVVVEEGIIEDKLKENGIGSKGLIGSKDDEDGDIFKMIKMIIVRAFDPGICVNFSKRKREFLAMQMEKMDLGDSKEPPHEGVIKCSFATETFRIEPHMPAKHVVFTTVGKFNWDDEGKHSAVRFAFDPGGDASPKFLPSTLVVGSWFPP